MGPVIKKAETREDINAFIRFPWNIYRDDPCWVPPLIGERKKFLDAQVNPFFEHAEAEYYLALHADGTPAGRIALVLNSRHNEFHSEKIGFFGLFESVNDQKVADLLLDIAYAWCQAKGLHSMRGPFNLSTNHECGLLLEGFDTPPVMGIPYNLPYYQSLFEQWGLRKARDLISLKLDIVEIPTYLDRAVSRLAKRTRFTMRPFRMDRFEQEVDIMWDIYNEAWNHNWGFVPMTQREFKFSAEEMKPIVRPEFCLFAEVEGEPAGFSLTLPDVNQVLINMDGRLFPFGWARFLWGKSKINAFRVLALGVKKKFRRLGIDACLYHETYKQFLASGIRWCDMSWVLEDNLDILRPIERIGGYSYKRHRIYERDCEI